MGTPLPPLLPRRRFLAGVMTGATATAFAGVVAKAAADSRAPVARVSYAQQGEDIVLYDFVHRVMRRKSAIYLDIGAEDPIQGNNTYLLYSTGSRGVLVEPNPDFAARLRKVRPRDRVLNVGVGVVDGETADYFMIRGRPQLNTFSTEAVAMLQQGSKENVVERVVKMRLVSVDRIIREHFDGPPDVMSIDIEGWDLAILRTLDFVHGRPGAICAETMRGRADVNPEISGLLSSNGYVVRGGSFVNTIFVDRSRYA